MTPGSRTGTTTRAAVHASSGHRLGASHPRQEGPVDLRLVPPALAAWAAAALLLDAPPGWAVTTVAVCVASAGVLLVMWTARGRGWRARPPGRRRSWRSRPEPSSGQLPGRFPGTPLGSPSGPSSRSSSGLARPWGRLSVAASLLCAAAAGGSAALHGADLYRGPVPALAREYARVEAELVVTSDPRRARPRVASAHSMPPGVLLDADVVRVTKADGTATVTRAPVLVIVRGGAPPGPGAGPAGTARSRPEDPWLALLPSTRLRMHARMAPSLSEGGKAAAVLRVEGERTPHVIGAPTRAQRLAGQLRGGLREATDGLPADARALLPGLVVGDTSRVPVELEQAFRETDLTHLLAVSGANLTIVLVLLIGPPGTAQRVERRGLAPRLGLSLRTTALLGGLLTLGFVIVCRPDPSVLRAAACGLIALLAIATGRRRSLIPALAAAVLLLVLYDPWLARSHGFLLSVLATAALLTLAPRWSAALRGRGMPPRLADALAAAAAAQAVCAPVVAV
ncbi:ComEC/Rec2 family competence protein, partial [Streptomyces sp. G44]|uniref:ComEC/Rec2 family competence protein n=1 Tax=Streptomyces sp. G44 TaxID=2807632 RepID=UPI00195F4365